MPRRDPDLEVRYLSSHKGSETMDQRWSENLFEDIGSWTERDRSDQRRRNTPAQQMEHRYHQTEEVQTLPPEYTARRNVFKKKASERFPESRHRNHQIEQDEDFAQKRKRVLKEKRKYPLSSTQQSTLEWIKEHLEKGYTRQSKSPQVTPSYVKKKDKQRLRPCQDYRYLNNHMRPNAYISLWTTDLTTKLKEFQFVTKPEITQRYSNVQIKKTDQRKAAPKTNKGLLKPNVIFFESRNLPAPFEKTTDDYYKDLTEKKRHVVIYTDDIQIHACTTKEELETRTKQVLGRLQKHDPYLKLEYIVEDANRHERS